MPHGTHLLSLINEVLDLSKIEAGKLELNPEPVNLARLIDDVYPQAVVEGTPTVEHVGRRAKLASVWARGWRGNEPR